MEENNEQKELEKQRIKETVLSISVDSNLKTFVTSNWKKLKYRSRSHFVEDLIKTGLEEKRRTIGEIGGLRIKW